MFEIRFHGRGGQGAVTAAEITALAAFLEGKCPQCFPAFGLERRGAPVAAFLRIDDKKITVRQAIYVPDFIAVMDATLLSAAPTLAGLKPGGGLLINTQQPPDTPGRPRRIYRRDGAGRRHRPQARPGHQAPSPHQHHDPRRAGQDDGGRLAGLAAFGHRTIHDAGAGRGQQGRRPGGVRNGGNTRVIMTGKIILKTLSDYPEVPVSEGEMLINETGTWRFASPVFSPRPSPCSRACPLENDIPDIMRRLAEGDIEGAWRAFRGRTRSRRCWAGVCPGFCMADCNRTNLDERVSIRDVERFVGDRFSREDPPAQGPLTGKSVAVIGAGPAGLSAAYFLRILGYAVTVFEKERHIGGVPRLGIPGYRLPRRVMDAAVWRVRAMGAAVKTGHAIGPKASPTSRPPPTPFLSPRVRTRPRQWGLMARNFPGSDRGFPSCGMSMRGQ